MHVIDQVKIINSGAEPYATWTRAHRHTTTRTMRLSGLPQRKNRPYPRDHPTHHPFTSLYELSIPRMGVCIIPPHFKTPVFMQVRDVFSLPSQPFHGVPLCGFCPSRLRSDAVGNKCPLTMRVWPCPEKCKREEHALIRISTNENIEATNKLCASCSGNCKQTNKCVVVFCPLYVAGVAQSKRQDNR